MVDGLLMIDRLVVIGFEIIEEDFCCVKFWFVEDLC